MVARVALLVYPGFHILDLSVLTILGIANHFAPGSYAVDIVSMRGGNIETRSGVPIGTQAIDDTPYDTLLVASTPAVPTPCPGLLDRLRQADRDSRRIAGICTAAFLLAEAGLLDGRAVTTHWSFADTLATRFPQLRVQPDQIYVRDGKFWSSAGMTAGIDMVLGLVESDLGHEVTRAICKTMVLSHRRPGGTSQFSVLAEIDPKQERIQRVLSFIRENLREPLTIQQLADHVNWSARHFSRTFQAETGLSPAKAIEKLRVQAAQSLMESGHSTPSRIAVQTGFGDDERMRRAFARVLGESPQKILRDIRTRKQA
ncbi:MAG TPA: helix-turn-helix domain-containing protein [Herbaspirillum sp.]|uniref:GlxA family transcriptional regulator n=1 Tax=Herbaspirillum sp. TaxID=1890675 RepID=UPI002D3B7CA1|nr:helix-turn-helix domain-containing protein [Herbaspirillum sp.]HZG20722.1 helix-turn-helix domain-containing protein [Herbaspirillum sp.]